MENNLHNLNGCPEHRVASEEVNKGKKTRREIAYEVGNKSIKEEQEFGVVSGDTTVNRTEATKALYKLADGIVRWGVSNYPPDVEYTKIKPKQTRDIWENICIIKGYNVFKSTTKTTYTPTDKFIDIDELLGFHNIFVSNGNNWDCKEVKDCIKLLGLKQEDLQSLLDAYARVTDYKGLLTQMEWLALAIYYLEKNTDCLLYLEDKIDIVLKYKFSMDLAIERRLVKTLSRACKLTDRYKNIQIVESLFSINKDSNIIMQLVPTARYVHEVYKMPLNSGIYCDLEYVSVAALEDALINGDTLNSYKSICYFRGKLPESVAIDLMNKLNRNRIKNNLNPVGIIGAKGVDASAKVLYSTKSSEHLSDSICELANNLRHKYNIKQSEHIYERYIIYAVNSYNLGYNKDLRDACKLRNTTNSEIVFIGDDEELERIYRTVHNRYKDNLNSNLIEEVNKMFYDYKCISKNMYEEMIYRIENDILPCLEGEFGYIRDLLKRELNKL